MKIDAQKYLAHAVHPTALKRSAVLAVGLITGMATPVGVTPLGATAHAQTSQCPSGDAPTFEAATEADANNALRIKGAGWCNAEGLGGAKIAVKLDEGSINHLDTSLHENTTIWHIIEAGTDGSFDLDMPLPDGTESGKRGSKPAFGPGEHSIRLLSGSLQDGDVRATLPSPAQKQEGKGRFVLGEYKPNGVPDVVFHYENDLTTATKNGVSVHQKGDSLEVTVESRPAGDWVYLSAYNECGQTNDPYGEQWFQLKQGSKVQVPLKPVDALRGNVKVTVQDGNRGGGQKLIGWDYLDKTGKRPGCAEPAAPGNEPAETTSEKQPPSRAQETPASQDEAKEEVRSQQASTNDGGNAGTSKSSQMPTTNPENTIVLGPEAEATYGGYSAIDDSFNGAEAGSSFDSGGSGESSGSGSNPKPDHDPVAPVAHAKDLNDNNAGEIEASIEDTILSLHAQEMAAGDWVYLHSYNPEPKALGWVQADIDGNVYVDIAALQTGSPKITLTSEEDELLGWVLIELDDAQNARRASVKTASSDLPLMDGRDWALILGACLLVAVAAAGLALGRRTRG
ncbi:hypothetical protein [Corynebacterium gerontici]|uniref:Uncharacterized protein n=1 Tax=Corynebacterium gerontici TaxID=2079234 RepID=A0A3G6J7W5_9CORY|nr:hypothetical protein [Corynebacterium gerontici]AZA12124.1 hypothetical protein CGERO_09165 [Corynebacterium gerontici]